MKAVYCPDERQHDEHRWTPPGWARRARCPGNDLSWLTQAKPEAPRPAKARTVDEATQANAQT